ncbi:bifunctional 2-polyprenyl-6-hydroxyphenol methylase/3-demethylubiquinol 3-O-methyltransferase UbiG [Ferruginibacter sp. HRS2-29]|uniref:class I SAM-dependent methyltransferase n=1 Tax=Ferruginibacter sp. HRS2-29 TaxID=2487334 RepID=UPI0020CF057C|nr:class I SAM-dependent methyltransferase [Ferruginibacter sp. HRS2-29]MCP9750617.1 methyltransferase domain-containing protein [Ferruginibacter sp. HRS2-29]
MFEFHQDKKKYFDINSANAKQYIMPFIEEKFTIEPGMRVLELGCGEGGVLRAFLDRGMTGVGIELDKVRLVDASEWLSEEIAQGKVSFFLENIYNTTPEALGGKFDLILLKDVIEHIPNQQQLIAHLQHFLTGDGVIFFGFPPWQMPLGGHQQILQSRFWSKVPYYHLLPMPVYKWILRSAKENVDEMVEIKETGISIERFEKITGAAGYSLLNKKHYLINPIYQYKFGWKPRKQFAAIQAIPWVRNFLTTCVYYLIQKAK